MKDEIVLSPLNSLPGPRLPNLYLFPGTCPTIKLTLPPTPADCINRINEPIKSHMISSFCATTACDRHLSPPGAFCAPCIFYDIYAMGTNRTMRFVFGKPGMASDLS